MGYTTKFAGTLKFSRTPSVGQLQWLAKMLADYDHEWLGAVAAESAYPHQPENGDGDFRHYVDLRLTKDLSGIEWDSDTEKNSGMVTALKVLQHAINALFPDDEPVFFEGTMTAQGEDPSDVWGIEAAGGTIRRIEMKRPHETCCPRCQTWFETSKAKTRG